MAVGDAFSVLMGTAETDRRPAVGVEERVMTYVKPDQTDTINMYDGTSQLAIIYHDRRTDLDFNVATGAGSEHPQGWNCREMITNSIYLRKNGTTDIIAVSGVQTNA